MRSVARLAVSARPDGSGMRVDELRSVAPVAFRRCGETVHLVGTAASPVGDDDTAVEVDVGAGTALVVRSVAATVAWCGAGTRSRTTVAVGDGATLRWEPEPLIATSGCDHRIEAQVSLHPGSTLWWWERLILGRCGESPGTLLSHLSVEVAGRPLLRHELSTGPAAAGWDGPAVLGHHRCTGVVLGAFAGAERTEPAAGVGWALMPLAGPGVLAVAVADDAPGLDRALATALAAGGTALAAGGLRPSAG